MITPPTRDQVMDWIRSNDPRTVRTLAEIIGVIAESEALTVEQRDRARDLADWATRYADQVVTAGNAQTTV